MYLLISLTIIIVCVWVGYAHAMDPVWRPEDDFAELALSIHFSVGSGD